MKKSKVRVFGLRRSGTNLMEWIVRNHFDPDYERIESVNDVPGHKNKGKKESLKHCLPKLDFSDKAIVVCKNYEDWVESIKRIGYNEHSKKVYDNYMSCAVRLPNTLIVHHNSLAAENYRFEIMKISMFLGLPLEHIKEKPKKKFARNAGKTFLKENFD